MSGPPTAEGWVLLIDPAWNQPPDPAPARPDGTAANAEPASSAADPNGTAERVIPEGSAEPPAGQVPAGGDADVPAEAVIGAWYVDADGVPQHFRSNPEYVPSSPEIPTDPVDAQLKLAARGAAGVPDLLAALPAGQLHLALDEDDSVIVTRAPDGAPSVLVVTALAHARELTAPAWREVTAAELAAALPAEGVDVLLNPAGSASVRLGADEFRAAVQDAAAPEGTATTEPPDDTPSESTADDSASSGPTPAAAPAAPDERSEPADQAEPGAAAAPGGPFDPARFGPRRAEPPGLEDSLPPPPSFPGLG